ncbi:MAG: DUF3352 domain-containing protein [Deltaproteobacteria bacterium]|nr:DUF3352 domain-containing protein [Deltaproteobacteria bacterium]
MRIVECPVCGRKYRFDESKMTKERIRVVCRKCENAFVISKELFQGQPGETPAGPPPPEQSPPPPPEKSSPMTLVIKRVPGEMARLRIATQLMPYTGESVSLLRKKLSRTPVVFHLEMKPSEADRLMGLMGSTGVEAALSHGEAAGRTKGKPRGEGIPKKMWRNLAAAVVVLALVGAGGLSYHLYRETEKTRSLEQRGIDWLIPGEPFFYIRLTDVEENQKKIQKDPAHAGLVSLVASLKSIPGVEGFLSALSDWEASTGVPFFRPSLMDLIGRDARLALYQERGADGPEFVLTLRTGLKPKLVETIGKWLALLQGRLVSMRMEGTAVYAIQPPEYKRRVYFFSEGMVYVVSDSPDLVRKSVLLMRGEAPGRSSLGSVRLLAERGKRFGVNQIALFYVGFGNMIGSWLGKRGSGDAFPLTRYLGAYGDVVGTISYGKGVVVESTMEFRPERLDGFLAALLKHPPAPNRTLAYVPGNTVIYASNTSLDLVKDLSWFRRDLGEHFRDSAVLDRILSGILAETGLDVEKEVLPYLGREFAYAVTAGIRGKDTGFPAVQLFLEVRNRARVEASIGKILKTPGVGSWLKEAGVDLVRSSYEGVQITSFRYHGKDMRLLLLSSLSPCYAFVDGFLVISTGLENLKQMVDLSNGRGVSMLKNGRFTEAKHLLRRENNGLAYVDLRAAAGLLKGLITRGPPGRAGLPGPGVQRTEGTKFFLELLEKLNFLWGETEFRADRVRFLVYFAL